MHIHLNDIYYYFMQKKLVMGRLSELPERLPLEALAGLAHSHSRCGVRESETSYISDRTPRASLPRQVRV